MKKEKINPKAVRLAFKDGSDIRFNAGQNVTIRMGSKWLRHWLNNGEEPIEAVIVNDKGVLARRADISGVVYIPIYMLKAEWLALNCDRDATDTTGLMATLADNYGCDISAEDWVSVIFFTL